MPPKPSVNHEQRAALAWPVLAEHAASRTTITYSALAQRIGIHHRAVGWALYPIHDHCYDRYPPLTSIVVSARGSTPSKGFSDWRGEDLADLYHQVFDFDWQRLPNPFEYALDGESIASLAHRLVTAPPSSESVYRLVKVRGPAQTIFREALRDAYDNECAFCGLTFVEALDAAHILPWAEASPKQRLDVRNGLLLCSNHHRLFDAGTLAITEAYTIEYLGEWAADELVETDRALSSDLHGKKLRLPARRELWPDPRMIRLRHGYT